MPVTYSNNVKDKNKNDFLFRSKILNTIYISLSCYIFLYIQLRLVSYSITYLSVLRLFSTLLWERVKCVQALAKDSVNKYSLREAVNQRKLKADWKCIYFLSH